MKNIDTYTKFKEAVVEPDFHAFMSDWGNLRKAWHCAVSLFHLSDWVYEAHKQTIDAKYQYQDRKGQTQPVSNEKEFANALGQQHPAFQLIRGVANAAKHCKLKSGHPQDPLGMPSHAANTYVAFQIGEVKLQGTDVEFASLAQAVLTMWNDLFAKEGW